jgi:hypothetical protein
VRIGRRPTASRSDRSRPRPGTPKPSRRDRVGWRKVVMANQVDVHH